MELPGSQQPQHARSPYLACLGFGVSYPWGAGGAAAPSVHLSLTYPPTEQKRDAFARFIEEVVGFDFFFFF